MTKRQPLNLMQKWLVPQYWVCQQPQLTRASFCVLMRLLDRQNTKTGRCDPSAVGLAEETGFSERSIRGAFKELEERGVIKRNRVARRSRNQFLIYSVAELEQNQRSANPKRRAGQRPSLQPAAATPAMHCLQNLQRTAPETIKETIKKNEGAENTNAIGQALSGDTGRQPSLDIDLGEFERRIVKVFEREGYGYEGLLMLPADEMEHVFQRLCSGHLSFGEAVGELLDSYRTAREKL
ncbi:helix-turn-helix domain-containing protein [Parasedimentitalea psychrophila]|uniref:Helix-turn-helix domain-containing protein n=1 Tax=Parasedimentitalea psychrophila TaxID=2997337 RepID=A0A9Y2KXJ2_9RHOB|nr:helix-turn-helix domain-containing protein [Parasedimentitalea psychrophila]WIY24508.1 helix-turn-helix domain-containing protein [Parasedimentitalea psychrophila]